MKNTCLLLIKTVFLFNSFVLFSQVGIGTTSPDASSALEIESTTSGLLIPRLTQVQRDTIATPATGLLIFQTDNTSGFYYYDGSVWQPFGGGAADSDWTVSGNNMYNNNTDYVGVGTTNPTTKLHIENTSSATTILNQDFETVLTPLTTSGDANWFIQTTSVNAGTQAAESGNIADSQESILEYSATVPVTGATLSFYYEVSSESNYDFLEFSIGGTVIDSWSGTIPWTNYTYNFTGSGTHTIRWRYFKDSSADGGSDLARVDDITLTSSGDAAIRIVDGNQSLGKVLTSDANGNGRWTTLTSNEISDIPNIATIDTMEIPICDSNSVGSTGTFNTTIKGVATTVTWEILQQQTTAGQIATISGQDVLVAPFLPERLQVRYDFSPNLPFNPNGIIFSANNTSTHPDTFSLNYASKSQASIIMNITRTDTFGDTSASCWAGQFYFDIFMTVN